MWRFVSDEDTNKNVFFATDVDEVPSSRSFKFSGRQKNMGLVKKLSERVDAE